MNTFVFGSIVFCNWKLFVTTPQTIISIKGVNMFQLDSINVPVLGVVENMSFWTPEELPKINIIFW